MRQPRGLTAIALIAFGAVAAGCGTAPRAAPSPRLPSVSGSIMLDGAGAFTPTALLTLRLVNLARTGTDASRIVVEQLISKPGVLPYRFRLPYHESAIDFSGDYGVEASVSDGGHIVWEQMQPTPVLTKGRPEVVEIVLRRKR